MAHLVPGQYVQLSDGRNGTIRFVGTTLFAAGEWVGVELEDESGKNDGSVQGERYFDVEPRRGMFVRPGTVTVLAQPQTDRQTVRSDGHEKAAGNGGGRGRRVSGRPSSLLGAGGAARGAADPGLGKRISLNAPSPTPTRTSRPSSIARVSHGRSSS
jgi:dynactin 1